MDLLSMMDMIQRRVESVLVFNEKEHGLGFEEFLKQQHASLVLDCNTSTSLASRVLSLVALDSIDLLHSSESPFQNSSGVTVRIVSPLQSVSNLEIQNYVRLIFDREPRDSVDDKTTIEGIMKGIY